MYGGGRGEWGWGTSRGVLVLVDGSFLLQQVQTQVAAPTSCREAERGQDGSRTALRCCPATPHTSLPGAGPAREGWEMFCGSKVPWLS